MNILLFVLAMLMTFSLITYTRLESIRSQAQLHAVFEHYMTTVERDFINRRAQDKYHATVVASKETKGSTKKEKPEGTSRLSWKVLIDKTEQTKDEQLFQDTKNVSKKLIAFLFGNQKFYLDALAANNALLDTLLDAIIEKAELAYQEGKLVKSSDLANLQLQDAALNELFYKMLKGTPKIDSQSNQESKTMVSKEIEEGDGETEAQAQDDQAEHRSEVNYNSLLDYITFKNAKKVRVFLASRPLLMAIFEDDYVVQDLLDTRYQLYRQVVNEQIKPEEAKDLLQRSLGSKLNQSESDFLDFSVSKVNPRNYE